MSELTMIIIAEGEKSDAQLVIESVRSYNDIDNLKLIVYDNTGNRCFREWAEAQTDFTLTFSDGAEEKYGNIIIDIIRELEIVEDLLILPDSHLLFPGVLSRMLNLLSDDCHTGALGANYNGSCRYGLGKAAVCNDYDSLMEYELNADEYSWVTDCLDENGAILIRKELLPVLVDCSKMKMLGSDEFRKCVCELVRDRGYVVRVAASVYFWNLRENLSANESDGVFFTVGVPSYNRGHRALELTRQFLKDRKEYGLESEIELVVSDNESDKNTAGYEEISRLSQNETNMIYYRAPENGQLLGNISNILEKASGKFCLLISDEDKVFFPGLILYVRYLKQHPEIAVMKGWTTKQYSKLKPCYHRSGAYAIDAFFLKGNYLSGIIYNTDVITSCLIKEYKRRYEEEYKNRAFPYYNHMFLDTYGLLRGAFASSDIPLIEEGKPESVALQPVTPVYASIDERIEQGVGFIKFIKDLNIPQSDKVKMFIMVFNKTCALVGFAGENGKATETTCNDDLVYLEKRFKDSYMNLNIDQPDIYRDIVWKYMDEALYNGIG